MFIEYLHNIDEIMFKTLLLSVEAGKISKHLFLLHMENP